MKQVTIALLDGDHVLQEPSFYTLAHMSEHGFNVSSGLDLTDPLALAAAVAALLSDSEPVGKNGEPVKVWTPMQAAKLMPLELDGMEKLATSIALLLGGDEDSGEADAG